MLRIENLTPFLKLLPCKSRAGLAQLLYPRDFDADWDDLGVHVRSTDAGAESSLGVQAVLDPVRRRETTRCRDTGSTRLIPKLTAVFSCQVGRSSLCSIVALTFPVASRVRARYILSPLTSVGISFHRLVSSNDTASVYSPTSHKDTVFSGGE